MLCLMSNSVYIVSGYKSVTYHHAGFFIMTVWVKVTE